MYVSINPGEYNWHNITADINKKLPLACLCNQLTFNISIIFSIAAVGDVT